MSWSFSLALVEEFKQQGCLVTASYARLKEIRTVEKSLWLARKTGQSRPSPSGTMPEPLTVSLGVAPLMSSVVDSRVSPSAAQENAKGLKTSATCGLIPSESFASYDPESSSWRTSPDLFGSTSPVFWETWPKQGTIVNGGCWERETSELHTFASGCGFMLPTPTAQTYGTQGSSGTKRPSLETMARHNLWPTPQAHDATKGNANRVGRYGTKHGGRNLNDWVMKWPTPQARDYKGVPGNNFNMSSLPRAVNQWPTPTANEDAASTPNGKMQPMLGNHPGVRGTTPEEWSRGSLNPLWVEWLMGWPIGWTGLEPLGTGKCPSATPQPGDC